MVQVAETSSVRFVRFLRGPSDGAGASSFLSARFLDMNAEKSAIGGDEEINIVTNNDPGSLDVDEKLEVLAFEIRR